MAIAAVKIDARSPDHDHARIAERLRTRAARYVITQKRNDAVLKGLGGLANLPGLMKQAQEMGGKLQQLNEEAKKKTVTGSSGAGLIEVDSNGLGEVLSVRIDRTLIDKQDQEMIEDLLPAAINAARQKAQELHAQSMQQLTGGLNLPGLSDALNNLGGTSDNA